MINTTRVRLKFLLGETLLGSWYPRVRSVICNSEAGCMVTCSVPDLVAQYPAEDLLLKGADPVLFQVGISRLADRIVYVQRLEKTYFAAIQGTYDDYLGRRSSKSRYNIKRVVKKLQDRNPGPILRIYTTATEMKDFHKSACEISRHTYQSKLLDAGLPSTPDFLRSMEAVALRGEARGYLLFNEGQNIAFAWCTSRGSKMTYNVIGYLPEASSLSPGTALLALIIEDLHKLGCISELDFGVGESFYKNAFSTDNTEHVDVFLFRFNLKILGLVHLHQLTNRLSELVGDWLERRGLKAKIKILVRKIRGARGGLV